MARNLLAAGHEVQVYNRTRSKAQPLADDGAAICKSAPDAAKDAEFVILMLSDADVCERILEDGVYGRIGHGCTLIVMASTDVKSARRQNEQAAKLGFGYLDAPVSGGEKGAREGTLVIMAGGSSEQFDKARDVFAALGRATHVGSAGSGQMAKITNQVIVALSIVAMSEALLLAEKGGADLAKVREALLGGFADSTILRQHAKRMIENDFTPGGPAKHQLKDLNTAMECAMESGLELPVLEHSQKLFAQFIENGGADLDHSGVIIQLRELQVKS